LDSSHDEIITATTTTKLGKIVKIKLAYKQESQLIHSIRITGDFFVHPEEVIEQPHQVLLRISLEGKEALRASALAVVQSVLEEEEGAPLVDDLLFTNLIVQ